MENLQVKLSYFINKICTRIHKKKLKITTGFSINLRKKIFSPKNKKLLENHKIHIKEFA